MTPEFLLAHYDSALPWPEADPGIWLQDVAAAYQSALAVRALRIARGEHPVGFKIGFTNRQIWERYGVRAPIWGTVWDSTVRTSEAGVPVTVDLQGTCQPRLEPEIVFGMRATPPREASLEQLFECVEWLAPGFEVVQSHRIDWKFSAADTVADSGLHARLIIGSRIPVRDLAASGAALDSVLARCQVRLLRDGAAVETGKGSFVLDGPLHALRHFVLELQACPGAPALLPGDVVTTGTWTDAWPLLPGQRWQAGYDAPLGSLQLLTR